MEKQPRPDTLQLVYENHKDFLVPIKEHPDLTEPKINALRVNLIQEELNELKDALGIPWRWWEVLLAMFGWQKPVGSHKDAYDALLDIQWVTDGSFLSLGFYRWKLAGALEVARANKSKLGPDGKPIFRKDGKYMKGPNYVPPDLGPILLRTPPEWLEAQVMYQSALSGGWYVHAKAAGSVCAVSVDGVVWPIRGCGAGDDDGEENP